MCECPVQGEGPKGLKTEAAFSPGFGSRTPSQSQVFQEPRLNHRSPLRASRRKHISSHLEQSFPGTSLVVQWLRSAFPVQGTWVQSLVGELRSHMAKKKKKRKKKKKKNGPFLPHENLLTGQGITLHILPKSQGLRRILSVSPASL